MSLVPPLHLGNRATLQPHGCSNLDDTSRAMLADDPVVQCLRRFIRKTGKFEGTATELLGELRVHAENLGVLGIMPKAANGLSQSLKRIDPNLEKVGLQIEWYRAGNSSGDRIIRIWSDIDPVVKAPVAETLDKPVGPLMQEAGRP